MTDLASVLSALLPHPDPLVATMDRFAEGWPLHANGRPAEYLPLSTALACAFPDDRHATAYAVPSIPRRLAGAGAYGALLEAGIPGAAMVLLLVDVEPAGHAPVTPGWWAAERAKIEGVLAAQPGGFCYRTRGGYRLVYRLPVAYLIAGPLEAARWKAMYAGWLAHLLERHGIAGDTACKDWTRLYRLPYVVRDAVPQVPETIGDPRAVGCWTVPPVDVSHVTADPTATPREPGTLPPASPALLADVAARLAKHGPAIMGAGGDQHTFAACAIAANDYALDEDEALAVLTVWDAGNQPPWGRAGLREKLANASAYAAANERGAEREAFEARASFREAMPAAPTLEQSIARALANQSATARANEAALAVLGYSVVDDPRPPPAGPPPPDDPQERFAVEMHRAMDEVKVAFGSGDDGAVVALTTPLFEPARGLFGRAFPATPWLVRGLLIAGGVGVISTEPKSAKTWLATEIAVAVATGTRACGKFETGGPRRVGYFYAEDLGEQVRNKIRALCAARKLDPAAASANLFVQPRGRHIDLAKPEYVALLVASCRAHGGVDLLVLDPLRDIHSGEEDSADSMVKVMRAFRVVAELLSCTVLFVHHSHKASADSGKRRGGQKMRGSSVVHGSIDSGIYLSDLEGDGKTTFTNQVETEVKGARSAGAFSLKLELEDDASGAATLATWTVEEREGGAGNGKRPGGDAEGDDAKLLALVTDLQARGGPGMKSDLVTALAGQVSKDRVSLALGRLMSAGRVKSCPLVLTPHGGGRPVTQTVFVLPDYAPPRPPAERARVVDSSIALMTAQARPETARVV
jgi:hypothetical protein